MSEWATEIQTRERFGFGRNWQKFLDILDESHIAASEKCLLDMLDVPSLSGMTFVDAGSGSGLSSLAAIRLGARQVYSFDFDPHSVACTRELKHRYFPSAANWIVSEGSVLNRDFLEGLGKFDIVYSWGVLHHTGQMWTALGNISMLAANGGKLFIALYNDEGSISKAWKRVKISYNSGILRRSLITGTYFTWLVSRSIVTDVIVRRTDPRIRYRNHRKLRGMSFTRDVVDWLGGYPYEVASAGDVFEFFRKRGFVLTKMKILGHGHGNNEFVFSRCAE